MLHFYVIQNNIPNEIYEIYFGDENMSTLSSHYELYLYIRPTSKASCQTRF